MKIKTLLVLSLIPMMVGCGNQNTSGGEGADTIEITDMQNRKMTINKKAIDRVVCLGAGALRYYSYIGDVSKVVGVEEIDGQTTFGVGQALRPYYLANQSTFSALPTVGRGGPQDQTPHQETIAAARPNIIISFYSDASVNDELASALEVPVVALLQGQDGVFAEDTLKSFELLGKVFGKETKAKALVDYINSCKADFDNLTISEDTYYAGCIGRWGTTNISDSQAGFPVFKYAKVKNAYDLDKEGLVHADPDKIFVDTSGINNFVTEYKKEGQAEIYDSLKAFENGETYLLLPYNAYYTNLEIQLMSTYYVASIAHPTEFATLNFESKANEITNKFLGKELYTEMKAHQYGFGGYQKFNIKDLVK
ncbi:MAG: ABC transporter substrate-binding protein [Bacilli bacterium]|nr:ABC transporter substrate-binding protein [Bacilli bacterium]